MVAWSIAATSWYLATRTRSTGPTAMSFAPSAGGIALDAPSIPDGTWSIGVVARRTAAPATYPVATTGNLASGSTGIPAGSRVVAAIGSVVVGSAGVFSSHPCPSLRSRERGECAPVVCDYSFSLQREKEAGRVRAVVWLL